MAKVYLKKLLEGNLPLTDDDFTMSFTNEGNLYITKQDGSQLKVSDLMTGYDDKSDLQLQNPQLENKLYLTKNHKLYVYDGSKYELISGGDGQGVNDDILSLLLELEDKTDTFEYNNDDEIVSMSRVYVNPNLDNENTVYSYDVDGNIQTEVIDKMGKIITNTFSYDSGNVIEMKTVVVDK